LGQLQITKVIEGDPIEYLVNLFRCINFPCFASVDFHGFLKCDDETLKFEFASRTTGIKFFDEQTSHFFMADWESRKKLFDHLKSQTLDQIKENWLNVHSTMLRYKSGFQPDRLVCAVTYFEPLNHTIEEIFGEKI